VTTVPFHLVAAGWPVWLLVIAVLALLSCKFLRQRQVDGDFAGLERALKLNETNDGVVRLLFVHGMGDPEPGYSDFLTGRLTAELALTHQLAKIPELSIDKDGHHYGCLRTKSYHKDGKLRLRVYELTWSPTVETIKKVRFKFDETFGKYRLLINCLAKRNLMNLRLADPILYTGTFKEHMQYPVMRAITAILGDQFNQQLDEFAVVTYSLGSRMTFDTLVRMSDGEQILNEAPYQMENANRLIERTGHIFMLANQLPLLALGNMVAPDGQLPLIGLRKLVHQCSAHAQARQNRSLAAEPVLHIVSFSDPNDLLSYPLDEASVREGIPNSTGAVTITNVRISIARVGWLRVFANPAQAHTGFDHNDSIPKFLAHGSRSKTSISMPNVSRKV
jgi:hypothetical protein